jgi:hypothetical protein
MHSRVAAGAAIMVFVAACSSAQPSTVPSSTADALASSPRGTPGVTASTAPTRPEGAHAWPTTNDVELHGTYAADPPFRIPFTLTIDEGGWYSGHLHDTFIDLQRFDGMAAHQFPNRMLGFADPDHFRGASDIDATGLTPDAALDLLAGRASLTTSNRGPQRLLGTDGARIDIHSATESNPLFGNGVDHFGLGPQLDIRMAVLPRDGRLFVVCVLAVPGDLDGAWEQALGVLDTMRFPATTAS